MKKQAVLTFLFTLVLLLLMTVSAFAAETADSSELTQLAAPTELSWGRDYNWNSTDYNDVPGFISWKRETPTQNIYQIIIYSRDTGKEINNVTHHYPASKTPPYLTSTQFIEGYWYDEQSAAEDCNFDSGTYYFTVQALGDGTKYSNSKIATSPDWIYTKPTTSLAAPTNLHWVGRRSLWDPPANTSGVGGYMVEYYWYDMESQEYISVGGTSYLDSYSDESPEDYLEDYCIEEYGAGQYYFRVRALSSDITAICSSPWSELSPVYNLKEITADVDRTLDTILDDYAGMDLTAEDMDALKEEIQEGLDTESLAASMAADQTDSGTVSKIEELEELVGGPANVNVSDNVLTGLDTSSISIIGANLNTEGDTTATLNISAPSQDAGVIPEQYHNTVQFSMKLDGVTETEQKQQLKVPVKITMPVPNGITPAFLVLLHFHSDGAYEEIQFPYVYKDENSGQMFVSFVVTSFSDFAFAQRGFGISSIDLETNTVTASVASVKAGTLAAAVYEGGRMTGIVTEPLKENSSESIDLTLPALSAEAQVKLFLFDVNGIPLYEAAAKPVTPPIA